MHVERVTLALLGGQQAGPNEDVDSAEEIVNTERILDDPLYMRAGLVVNGVCVLPPEKQHIDNLALPVAVYSALRD